ncbi:MAG: TetR/AcrR family transcriptional regulator [Actinomycetota bacterium]|nr:TetR/AcrR family transcriptional regulator [Actinomycetota bacterium]
MGVERPVGRRADRLRIRADRPERKLASKRPITRERIVDEALRIVAAEGFDALTMRRVAAAINTGPASLYAHVQDKAHLDELLIGRLCSEVLVPVPDPARWQEQMLAFVSDVRDKYLAYPGLSRAGLAVIPTNLETLRISEGLLSILIAGDVPPQRAAWAVDALALYVAAYCLEVSLWITDATKDDPWEFESDFRAAFDALPADQFPMTKKYASELVAGQGHDRFDFAVTALLSGLGGSGGAGGLGGPGGNGGRLTRAKGRR